MKVDFMVTKSKAYIILGQKKAGTTTLYDLLSKLISHKNLPKESKILNTKYLFKFYFNRLSTNNTLLDGTTEYFELENFSPNFRKNLNFFEEVNIIYILRDEFHRAQSHFKHSVNYDNYSGSFSDFLTSSEYMKHADVGAQIKNLENYNNINIHFLNFEDLNHSSKISELISTLVCDKINVKYQQANVAGSLKRHYRVIHFILTSNFYQLVLKKCLPNSFINFCKRLVPAKKYEKISFKIKEADKKNIQIYEDKKKSIRGISLL